MYNKNKSENEKKFEKLKLSLENENNKLLSSKKIIQNEKNELHLLYSPYSYLIQYHCKQNKDTILWKYLGMLSFSSLFFFGFLKGMKLRYLNDISFVRWYYYDSA